ncbi:MAG: FAD-dependent oxidoreductase, partial [Planctomycetota bacterium]
YVPPAMRPKLTHGLVAEFDRRMQDKGGATQSRNPELMKQVFLEMVQEAGVKLLFYTLATDAIVEEGVIRGVIAETKAGPQAFLGGIVIACTGDGDIAARAGAPFELGRGRDSETQAMTLVFLLGNVDTSKIARGEAFRKIVHQARKDGALTGVPYGGGAAIAPVVRGPHGVVNVNSVNIPMVSGLRPDDLTYAHVECHREIMAFVEFFRKYVPGCQDAYVLATGASIGVRESRRILGEYVLTGADVLTARRFPDDVTRGFYPLDIHGADRTGDGAGARLRRSYGIPYRCLVPRKIDNLLVAGRCISTDHIAHGTIRVMGTTAALGEAAGTAAALCIRERVAPRDLDFDLLAAALKRHDAWPEPEEKVADNYALVTRGAKATADSYLPGRPRTAVGAIDGIVTQSQASRWLSDDSEEPHWLVIDFGQPRRISRVRLYCYDPENAGNRYVLADYQLQVDAGQGTWRAVATIEGNAEARPLHTFEPVTTRRLRLHITRACRADSIARLREIEVH